MSSKKQTNKTEEKSGLASHYRAIGIKAVAAATRKESTASPRTRDSDGDKAQKEQYGRRTQ